MGRMRIRHIAAAAVLAAAVLALATCSNPVDLVEAATVEVMKANDRYLEVVSTTPVAEDDEVNPGTKIRLVFDRDIDMDTVNASTVTVVKSGGGAVAWTATFDTVTHTLAMKPSTILGDSSDYTVTVSGIHGVDGSLMQEDYAWQFHTIIAPAGQVVVTSTNAESQAGYTNTASVTVTIANPNGLAEEYAVASSEAALDNPGSIVSWYDIVPILQSAAFSVPAEQGIQFVYAIIRDTSPVQYSAVLDAGIIYDDIAPTAPTLSGTTPTTDRTPTWSWSSGGGGIGTYRYQLDGTAGAWTTTSSTSYTPGADLALGNHTLYVQERDEAGNWSTNGSRTIGIAPLAPTGVAASVNTSTAYVAVSWTAPSGTIVKYYVDRATSSTGTYSNIGSVNSPTVSYNDTTAAPGTVYYYKVRAEGTNGYIGASSGYAAGYRKLAIPASVSAADNVSTSDVKVTWNAVTGAVTYYVERSTDNVTFGSLGSSAAVNYSDTTGTPGTLYYYRVRAYANGYYSDYSTSNVGNRRVAAPTGVSATDGTVSTGITVSWSGVTGAAGYYVYRDTNPTGTYSTGFSTTSTSYTDTTVSSTSTTYYYKVAAYGAAGYFGDMSTYDAGYRGLPATASIAASDGMGDGAGITGNNYVSVSWSAVTGATGYMVYRSTSSSGTYSYIGSTTALKYNTTPPAYKTTYYFKVRAYSVSTSYPGAWSGYNGGWSWNMTGDLTGQWTFNNSWLDWGYANSKWDDFTGTSGDPVYSTDGVVGVSTQTNKSADLDGNDMKTSSGYTFMSTDRKQVSVSFWVKPRATPSSTTYFMMCDDFGIFHNSSGNIGIAISLPSTNSASAPVALNSWTHIVGTYDGTTIRIYKNGSLYTSTTHAGTVYTPSPHRYLTLGGWTVGAWNGLVDDLRIYSRTLDSTEVYGAYIWRQTD